MTDGSFRPTDSAWCLVEVVYRDGEPVDHRFVEVNDGFGRQTGVTGAVGRTRGELAPGGDDRTTRAYAEVARTRVPIHMEVESTPLGRWFDLHVMPAGAPGENRVALLFTDITARVRDEQALRETREQLQDALDAGDGIGTWDWDVVADRVTANARFATLYGADPAKAAAGAPPADFFANIHPEDVPALQAAIAETLATGAPFAREYRLRIDGQEMWVLAQGRSRLDETGRVTRFVGVVFDITARKRAEARQATLLTLSDRLRDQNDPEEIAFEACAVLGEALGVSRVGYGVINKADETITIARDWNAPGVRSLAGLLHFRDYGSYIDDLKAGVTVTIADVAQDARTRDTADALRAISAASFVNMPLVEQGNLVALFFANHAEPRPWAEDDLALMRDVAERVRAASERVRAEAARRRSDEQFRVFAQAVPSHIWAANAQGQVYWFNDQALQYVGATRESRDPPDWGNILHPDDLPRIAEAWRGSQATGAVLETELRIRRHDGVHRWFLVRAEPVRAADGTVTRWVGTDTDIDDRRRQAQELAELNATLERQVEARTAELMAAEEALRQSQKMEAVGQLSGGIAHDFNNLLTGITGSLELMQARVAQGRFTDVERYVLAAQGAAKRAAALTHRLLAFSRRQTLDPRPTDVNRLVAGLEELIRRTVGPQIAVEVVAAGGLWPTLVDANQLENAILNLCINARDAMPDGGRLTIETANRWLDARAARERDLLPGQYLSICVSDTGTGMTPDVIARAFDPFFTTKPIGQGTGLGLSMIYGFVRQSGGQVRIYSEAGDGAMVCLYLPRHRGEAPAEDANEAERAAPAPGTGETVLVVDDEPTVRMLVIEVLEQLGYHALEAGDGQAGLQILRSDTRIDLLVSDVGLPGGMNGRQMVDAARAHRPDLPVLFITGYAENAVVGNGQLDAGMHVVTKPFAMDALAARIRELIAT